MPSAPDPRPPLPAVGPPRRARSPRSARLAAAALGATNGLLGLAARILWPRRRPRSVRRLAVWRTGNVGDLVCALPALWALREAWPEAEITLVSSPGARGAVGAAEMLEGCRAFDRLWTYHPAETSALAFARELRRRRFDAVVQLPQNRSTPARELRNMLFLRLAGVPWARGFAVGGLLWLGRGAARAHARHPELVQEPARQLAALARIGVRASAVRFEPVADAAVEAGADAVLAEHGWERGRVLAVAPGCKRATNRWPVERFAEVARRWTERGGDVVILGSGSDRELGARIAAVAGPRAVDLCGASPLPLSAALLARSALLVTNDTGVMHLAAAVGTPCAVAFSARDLPVRWTPWGEGHAVLRRAVPCSPCWLERCPHDDRCLDEIAVDEVWRAVRSLAGQLLPAGPERERVAEHPDRARVA